MPDGKNRIKKLITKAKDSAMGLLSDDTLEIHSNKIALISGSRKLKEYKDDRIVLEFRSMILIIEGDCLVPESLINGQMSVKGKISALRYEYDQKNI